MKIVSLSFRTQKKIIIFFPSEYLGELRYISLVLQNAALCSNQLKKNHRTMKAYQQDKKLQRNEQIPLLVVHYHRDTLSDSSTPRPVFFCPVRVPLCGI